MEEFLYLEADEEITSVIDKLRGLEAKSVGLVAPKGSTIAQSLVSLKLLQKEAKKLGKQTALVTSDDVGRNLAAQIGLPVYADVKSSRPLVIDSKVDEEMSREPIEIDMREKPRGQEDYSRQKAHNREGQEDSEAGVGQEQQEKLPKDFTIHRYDEREEESTEPSEIQTGHARPIAEDVEPISRDRDTDEEHFVKRPIGDLKDYSQRQEIEDSRPVRHQDIQNQRLRNKKNGARQLIITIASVIGVVAFAILADLSLAKLVVNLKIEADPIDKTVEIKVEKDRAQVDIDAGIIPGLQVVKENDVEETIAATGEKDAGEKAKGIISFKNESGVDETIASGSTIKSTSSVEFTLDSDVTVPKAALNSAGDKVLGQASGAITAKEAGTQGNMSASTIYAIVGKSKITAGGATTGGVTKKIKIVTKKDIENAKEELKNKNSSSLIEEAKNDNKDKIFLDDAGTLDLSDYQASKNINDEADEFVVKGKLSYTTLVFSGADLKQASVGQVEKTLDEDKGLVSTESDQLVPTIKEQKVGQGYLLLNSQIKSHVGPKIDMKQQALSWRGKAIKKVKEIAGSVSGVEVGSVELKPTWALPIAPIIYKNITINVEYSPKSGSGS